LRAIPAILGVMLAFLGIAAAAVFGLGDARVLVPPPEAVAEEFLRSLQTHRYPQARQDLDRGLREGVSGDELRDLWTRVERRVGHVRDVRGEKAGAPGEAHGILVTEDGEIRVTFRLSREHGEWHLSDFNALDALGSRLQGP
jgi:hypothetical protein